MLRRFYIAAARRLVATAAKNGGASMTRKEREAIE
jgi:hypothetical protein